MKKQSMRLLRCDDDTGNQQLGSQKALNLSTAKLKTPGMSSSSTSSMVVKRKVEELFQRLQPHSLVQWTEKLLATLRIVPKLFINGQELLPKAPPPPTVASATGMRSRRAVSTTAAWTFKPDTGRFHYGLSLQYTPSDTKLTLSSLNDISVMLSSAAMQTPRCHPVCNGSEVTSESWRLVAKTDRRVGLALYEIPLGDWGASSLVALVWTQNLEVARLYLQLHTTELLYSAPQRPLQFRCDEDLDRTHGLHSYTVAISLRSLDELFWEREVYQVEFPTPTVDTRSVTVQLLDDVHGGTTTVRDRMLTSETEPTFRVETEAVKYAMDNCFVVDFTLWDAECVPLWGFSRALELVTSSNQPSEDNQVDLSVSSVGGTRKCMLLKFQDEDRGNSLIVSLVKLSPSLVEKSTKKPKVSVSQIDLTLSLQFVNATFATEY